MKALLEVVKFNSFDVVTASTSCLTDSTLETPCQNVPIDNL